MFSAWNYLTSKFWWGSSSSNNVLLTNVTGKISISGNAVHWEIKDFFDLPQDDGSLMSAPSFTLAGKEWVWYLFPRGYKFPDSIPMEFQPTIGWFGMVLVNTTDREAFDVQLGVSGKKATIAKAKCFKDVFYSCTLFESAELHSEDIASDGILRVFCDVRIRKEARSVEVSTKAKEIAGTSSSPSSFPTDSVTVTADQGIDPDNEAGNTAVSVHKDVTDQDSLSNKGSDRNRPDSTARSETPPPNDFAPFNLFRLHADGNVSLNDRDTEILAQILQFRHSGEMPDTPSGNANRLLHIAEKCGVTQLIELIPLDVDSAMSSMTEDTVCDIMRLAELKGEAGLLEQATRFYEEKVLWANEWQIFDKDYMADAKQWRFEALKRRRLAKRKTVFPNDFSEMVYRKLVGLTSHLNNRDEGASQ